MRDVHLPGVDLNLLPALEALLRRRNVTEAARDVGLSQPAMSRVLARLRDTLEDPLLVRTSEGYVLSPRGEVLSTQIGATLDHVKGIFRPPAFDPARTERTIRMVGFDLHSILIAPALMARLAVEAPGIRIRLENYGPDIATRMRSGKLDLLFALAQTPLAPGVMSEVYARDRMVVVMRKGHPLARRRWTIEDFGRVEHAAISILGGEASETDALLARVGVKRDIRLVTPHFMGALATVSQTNMVTTIGRALASRFADELGLLFKESCLPNPDLDLTIVWSEACATDPVLAWVRTMIREVAAETIGACTDSRQTRVSRRAERL